MVDCGCCCRWVRRCCVGGRGEWTAGIRSAFALVASSWRLWLYSRPSFEQVGEGEERREEQGGREEDSGEQK